MVHPSAETLSDPERGARLFPRRYRLLCIPCSAAAGGPPAATTRPRAISGTSPAARAGSHRTPTGRIDNPGIVWGKGIEAQGLPWERHLAGRGDLGNWIAERVPNFKTFDFFDEATGLATSAKTLDTRAAGYVREPRRVFVTLKTYIDRIHTFRFHRGGRDEIVGATLQRRRLVVALRANSTDRQIEEVNRARAHAHSLGVEMELIIIR